MLELILVSLFIAISAWCLSKYLSKVMANQPMWGDDYRWIENPVCPLIVSPQQQMNWKQYSSICCELYFFLQWLFCYFL